MIDPTKLSLSDQLVYVKQGILTRKGYYNLRLDGIAGPGFEDAVTRCKAAHGLMARPYIGPLTDSLISAANEPNITPWGDLEIEPPVSESEVTTPPMLREARKHLGTREIPGPRSNPIIIGWASDLKAADALAWYPDDDIAWCGLFHAILALRCHPDLEMPPNVLSARNWGGRDVPRGVNKSAAVEPGWGQEGPAPQRGDSLHLGSTGIMWRTSRHRSWHGHIGIIDAQNTTHVRMIGGNQSNSVSRAWYPRGRFLGTRIVPGQTYIPAPTLPTGSSATMT
jgi:peptidoglycan hydrolase-like protein with peptidoglycan-binding domain